MPLAALMLLGGCRQKTPQELLTQGNELFSTRELIGAEAAYQELIEKHPESQEAKDARVGLALCFLQDQEYDRAREQLTEAITAYGGPQTPKGFETTMLKLQTYVQERQPQRALEEAIATSESMRAAPVEGQLSYQVKLSELFMANERTTEALEISQTLLNQKVPTPDYHAAPLDRVVQILLQRGDYAGAVAIYEKYLRDHPDSELQGTVLFGLGFIHREAGDTAAADASLNASETYFTKVSEEALGAEQKSQALIQLSRVREFRGDVAGATAALESVTTDHPSSENAMIAYRMLVDKALSSGNVKRAMELLQRIDEQYRDTQIGAQAYQTLQELKSELAQGTGTLLSTIPGFTVTSATLLTSGTLLSSDTLATTGTLLSTGTLSATELDATTAAQATAGTTMTTTTAPAL